MQAAQHGECRFTVQLADVPIVIFENQLAGEEHAVRKIQPYFFRQACEFFDGINDERHLRFRGKVAVVAIGDEESQCPFRLSPLLLQFIGTAVALRIDRARTHKDKIPEVPREFSPDPVQCVDATPSVRADHEDSWGLPGFHGRGGLLT